MKGLHGIAFILLIIGGLNWLLTAFGWGIGNLFAEGSMITKVIYVLVGLAAIVEIFNHKALCKKCEATGMGTPTSN
ncbi:MAG: DUF378 domain-containing protein [Patescibacteria group bacterium]